MIALSKMRPSVFTILFRSVFKTPQQKFNMDVSDVAHFSTMKRMQLKSNPILYYDEISPPVRFVLMTIHVLDLKIDFKKIHLFQNQQISNDYIKINPLHTVPTLVDGELNITDSHAICTYLANAYASDSTLYPQNPKDRAKVDMLLYFNSSIFFPRESAIFQSPFHKNKPTYSSMLEKFMESLKFLDVFCGESKWLAGDQVTLADLCCIATYSTSELLVINQKGMFPNVENWAARCKALPTYQAANVPGLQKLKEVILTHGNLDHIDINRDIIIDSLKK
ncbi:glutathione S-transferase 1-like isoform X2 [Arctopsyche grandis]|uniref:glutathione S-transferase 1-like isoform X2 n=1 Tax=Arctopsyche grandis TaxID=121162 RepID=UPI00406D9260